jgi:hypothetical protein
MADCGTGTRDACVPDQASAHLVLAPALTGPTRGREPGASTAGVDPEPQESIASAAEGSID